jgi:hypothetical protein
MIEQDVEVDDGEYDSEDSKEEGKYAKRKGKGEEIGNEGRKEEGCHFVQ